MENRIDKITNLTEKKPLQALIYCLLVAISVLAGVIFWQNNKLGSKEQEKNEAVKAERVSNFEEIKYWKDQNQNNIEKYDQCRDFVLQRTDESAKLLRKDYDELEERVQRSIISRKSQAVSIKKLTEDIPVVKPVTNQNDGN